GETPLDTPIESRAYFSRYQRLVVRFTNKNIIVQIAYARLQGDFILCAAQSRELPKYGIEHGLTNWTAAYATGLLCAHRALTKLGLADKYEGTVEPDGEMTLRTSTGSHIFGAMKGASDGGLLIPHSEKRFPGFDVLKKYIFGGHVAEYMESLEEEDDERFKKQFATYLADDIGEESLKYKTHYLTCEQRAVRVPRKLEIPPP
ncbi:translational machinery component, partial [Calocera viscosa TUFC12733]